MTDVTGVAIPQIDEKTLKIREIPTPVVNRLGMTVLLFAQYYFRETAPFYAHATHALTFGVSYCSAFGTGGGKNRILL